MTFAEKVAATDAIVRDLFANGGPQRPSSAGTYRRDAYIKTTTSAVLEAERQRLIKTWGK